VITQYGVLAYDVDKEGRPRFLLITSRSTRRWIIPRGNPMTGLTPARSAAEEGFEEAGLAGIVSPGAIGSYFYEKKRGGGPGVPAQVHVFPLRVLTQARIFPEAGQRETRWFAHEEAAAAVDEPALRELILGFAPPPSAAGQGPVRTIEAPPLSARIRLLRWLRNVAGRPHPSG
jgi:hypothetical protein